MESHRLSTVLFAVAGLVLPSMGQHLVFDEESDTVRVVSNIVEGSPGDTGSLSQMTLEAVVWVRGNSFARRAIFTELQPGFEDKQLNAWVEAGELSGAVYGLPGGTPAILTGTITDPGRWVHIAYVYDGTEERFYLDGSVVSRNGNVMGNLRDGPGELEQMRLGAIYRGPYVRAMDGAIDSLRVSRTVVYTSDEIIPPSGDLPLTGDTVLLFHFNEQPDANGMIYSIDGGYRGELGAFIGAGIEGSEPVVGSFGCVADFDYNGLFDLSDITAFITAFQQGESAADLAPPTGVFDLSDITTFIAAFVSGCS